MAFLGEEHRVRCTRVDTNREQLEGIFTVLVGICFLVFFPNQVSNPVSLAGLRYFSEREAEILYKRVMLDDPSKAHPKKSVSWPELREAVCSIDFDCLFRPVLTSVS